jgi:hypothetical protein
MKKKKKNNIKLLFLNLRISIPPSLDCGVQFSSFAFRSRKDPENPCDFTEGGGLDWGGGDYKSAFIPHR